MKQLLAFIEAPQAGFAGGYRIIERIGLGGMATVFKAYQPSMDRYVALKVLSTHLTQDPSFVKRFQQEAKVIAKLESAPPLTPACKARAMAANGPSCWAKTLCWAAR